MPKRRGVTHKRETKQDEDRKHKAGEAKKRAAEGISEFKQVVDTVLRPLHNESVQTHLSRQARCKTISKLCLLAVVVLTAAIFTNWMEARAIYLSACACVIPLFFISRSRVSMIAVRIRRTHALIGMYFADLERLRSSWKTALSPNNFQNAVVEFKSALGAFTRHVSKAEGEINSQIESRSATLVRNNPSPVPSLATVPRQPQARMHT